MEDFPELAVREAVGNAMIHRDYRSVAGLTSIRAWDDALREAAAATPLLA